MKIYNIILCTTAAAGSPRQGAGRLQWVNPSQQPNTHPASHSLPSPEGWGENRRKAKRSVDRDNDNFMRKAKAAHASKAKRGIHSLLPNSRQVFSNFLESRTSACVMVAWEDKCHSLEHFLLYLLFLSFYH